MSHLSALERGDRSAWKSGILPLQQRTDFEAEVKRSRDKNRRLKMERDILKKSSNSRAGQTGVWSSIGADAL